MRHRVVRRRAGGTVRGQRCGWLVAHLVGAAMVAGCGSSGRAAAPGGSDGTADAPTPKSVTAFGDLSSPCGEGDASGATERGVTDTSITIGYGDDAGFQQTPGLSHELSDAMKAMIDWCNDQG